MKKLNLNRTFQLFQLLIIVCGFYAAMTYTGNAKYILSISAIIVVGIIDRVDSFFYHKRVKKTHIINEKQVSANKTDPSKQSLKILLQSKNEHMLVDALQILLRDIGLTVVPWLEHSLIDRIIHINEQIKIAMLVSSDLNSLTKDLDSIENINGYIHDKKRKLRLLLVVKLDNESSDTTGFELERLPAYTAKYLAAHNIVAVTTKTMGEIFELSKKGQLDPSLVFGKIYQSKSGLFHL